MPLELMELRCGSSSTTFCTQYGSKDRHARLGGGIHVETIMGRLVHGTVWLKMGASTFASPPIFAVRKRANTQPPRARRMDLQLGSLHAKPLNSAQKTPSSVNVDLI